MIMLAVNETLANRHRSWTNFNKTPRAKVAWKIAKPLAIFSDRKKYSKLSFLSLQWISGNRVHSLAENYPIISGISGLAIRKFAKLITFLIPYSFPSVDKSFLRMPRFFRVAAYTKHIINAHEHKHALMLIQYYFRMNYKLEEHWSKNRKLTSFSRYVQLDLCFETSSGVTSGIFITGHSKSKQFLTWFGAIFIIDCWVGFEPDFPKYANYWSLLQRTQRYHTPRDTTPNGQQAKLRIDGPRSIIFDQGAVSFTHFVIYVFLWWEIAV